MLNYEERAQTKTKDLKKIGYVHKEIARRRLAHESHESIAQALGISASYISRLLRLPRYRAMEKELAEEREAEFISKYQTQLDELVEPAIAELKEIITGNHGKFLKLKAIVEILSRCGFNKQQMRAKETKSEGSEEDASMNPVALIIEAWKRSEQRKKDQSEQNGSAPPKTIDVEAEGAKALPGTIE